MSFATVCPACATRFRVVADQLKISEGWVRCGQCGEVFDATQDLVAWSDSTWAPVHKSAAPHSLPDEAATPPRELPDGALQPLDAQAEVLPGAAEEPEPVLLDFPDQDPDPEAGLASDSGPEEHDSASGGGAGLHRQGGGTVEEEPIPDVPTAPPWNGTAEPVGFVRAAQQRAWWHRRGVRIGLGLACMALCVVLTLQWVLHERHRIAALRPDWRPVLERLCEPLGCSVEPLRWVDVLSIDSTTLARRGNGRFVLEVVLRNGSPFTLAKPAIELSLTDSSDQLLLRRVLMPDELPGAELVPARDTMALRMEVTIESSVADALAGYRTLLFYP